MRSYETENVWSVYQDLIDQHPVLSVEEERDLIFKAQRGDIKARDKLVFSNLRYVVKNAKNYLHRGFTKEDVIEEGIIGLIIAVEKFDLDKDVRFITYAKTWINKTSLDAIYNTADMIRLPQNKVRSMPKMKVSSLDAPVGKSTDSNALRYEDLFVDDSCSPETNAEDNDMKNQVSYVLGKLSQKERDVVRLHNGINSREESLSYTKIGERMGISKQAVRQIEEKAFRKIRRAENARYFDGYLAA